MQNTETEPVRPVPKSIQEKELEQLRKWLMEPKR